MSAIPAVVIAFGALTCTPSTENPALVTDRVDGLNNVTVFGDGCTVPEVFTGIPRVTTRDKALQYLLDNPAGMVILQPRK